MAVQLMTQDLWISRLRQTAHTGRMNGLGAEDRAGADEGSCSLRGEGAQKRWCLFSGSVTAEGPGGREHLRAVEGV